MARDRIGISLIYLGMIAFVVMLFGAPDPAYAHAQAPPAALSLDLDIHSDEAEAIGAGHCHGKVSCHTGLHTAFCVRAIGPDRLTLPTLDRSPINFSDANLGREPPVPITLF